MQFVKMHGLGNDFVMVDARGLAGQDWSSLARRCCDRRFGIGADGLVLVLESATHDWRMRIINADGTEPEMCGNAIRCLARYLHDQGLESRRSFTVETLAGEITPRLVADGQVAVDMGEPRLRPEQIPFIADPGSERVVDALLQVDDDPMKVTCVSMGNPHCVVFVEDLEPIALEWWGPMIERHERFPQRTNVEFAKVHNRGEVTMRVWERGVGRTLACGTGACATAVAAVLNNLTDRQVILHLEGGDLHIEWREGDNHVIMTGPAATVFRGDIPI
ncbi:MAG: diaminopimelate epimerase [Armatimonadetes bacterium]|nr:diaminopimelate epimerase [Armatimonadota bacterium]